MESIIDDRVFPTLDSDEMAVLVEHGRRQTLAAGAIVYCAGTTGVDLVAVESGRLDVLNPIDGNKPIADHGPGSFAGDIDILTRRPVVVTIVAAEPSVVVRVDNDTIRKLLLTVPKLSEKLLVAFQVRRYILSQSKTVGMRVIGPGQCGDTGMVREFLFKNFVPFVYEDTSGPDGKKAIDRLPAGTRTPAVICNSGEVISRPSMKDVAKAAGIFQACPIGLFDLAVVGAGPAGMSAAVYAASEGLRTIVVDSLGPGGQAGGSSKIENFIGFPSGLSGTDLATRAVLQMFKFGAQMAVPFTVQTIRPAASDESPHELLLDCGSVIKAQTVLISSGVRWRKLNVPNVERFERAGIYYACTAVEAVGHEGTDVAVVGAGNSAGQAAMYLAESCAKVHLLVRRDKLGDSMSEYLTDRIAATKNVTVHYWTEVAEIHGERSIQAITVVDNRTKQKTKMDCSGIFVFIGSEPRVDWLPDSIARDELGFLKTGTQLGDAWTRTDREPCPLETSLPRVLAGGDVRSGTTKRVGFAVGDGSLAVTCVHKLRTVRA